MTDDKETKADQLVNILLSPAFHRPSFDSTKNWFQAFRQQTGMFSLSIDRALLGGRMSQCLGYAFAAGYQSAIEALFDADSTQLAAFCVSETGGNHPRSIQTRLAKQANLLSLHGEKSFVSGAHDAQNLYIACLDVREGNGLDHAGRPCLKIVQISSDLPGVELHALPPLGFIPEVRHGKVSLQEVEISPTMILPGDGYLDYIKPFRSYEDVHVLAAVSAYRLAEAIQGHWPDAYIDQYLALIMALRSLSQMSLNNAPAHIGLAAIREQFDELVKQTDPFFESTNPAGYEHWIRDRRLLQVAKAAHEKRTHAARQAIFRA